MIASILAVASSSIGIVIGVSPSEPHTKHGILYGRSCAENDVEIRPAPHYCKFGRVVHAQ